MSENYKKDIPDFVSKKAWQFVEIELNRSHWRSVKGARVEIYTSTHKFFGDVFPVVVVNPDGKTQSFAGEDAVERAWTIAEAFRKQEQ